MELIPKLPDEIAAECLVRVSIKSHGNLKGVCRRWRSLVKSPWFYEHRKTRGTSEKCIFMLQALPQEKGNSWKEQKTATASVYGITVHDPVQGGWKRIPSIPELANSVPLFSQCVSVKGKLMLIGGWHPSNWQPINCVFIYDLLSGRWTRGSDMPTLRSFFGCCASPEAGTVYVAGGHDEDNNALKTVEAYDVEKDVWESVPGMSKGRDECEAVLMEGQLVVISGFETESQWRFEGSAEFFNPHTRTWRVVENMWGSDECPRSCVAAAGRLYYFSKQGVMRYKAEENKWERVEDMPEGIRFSPCATVWREHIFVSGCRCSGGGETMCYMFDPVNVNGKWVAVERPPGFRGFVQGLTSLEL